MQAPGKAIYKTRLEMVRQINCKYFVKIESEDL